MTEQAYITTERGKFDVNLVNMTRGGIVVAYSDYDVVVATSDRVEADTESIKKFASECGFDIEWEAIK